MIKKILFRKKDKDSLEETNEDTEEKTEEEDEEELDDNNEDEEEKDDEEEGNEKDDNNDNDDEEGEEEEDDEEDNKMQNPHLPKEKSWIKKDGELTVDIYETKNDIVIMAPVGGVRRDEIEIITEKDMIIIKGNRERKESDEIKNFYSKECFFGPFSREIILPEETDPSRIKANLENGVLIIKAPKIEREKRRKIDI